MGWLVDMERKGCESSIHDHDIDFYVTMVGCVDVPDSDRGDFRRWRAVNISSIVLSILEYIYVFFCYVL